MKSHLCLLWLIIFLAACSPLTSITSGQDSTGIPTLLSSNATSALTPEPLWTPVLTDNLGDKIPMHTGEGWEVALLIEAGIDPVKMGDMLSAIYHGEKSGDTPTLPDGKPKYQNIDGILIVKGGRLVFEEYFNNYRRDFTHHIASVTKSITSLLVGVAIEQGALEGVDEEVMSYLPEYLPLINTDERKEKITVEDLLTMRTGMDCDDWDPASRTYYQKYQPDQPDDIKFILSFPMESVPGTSFAYCTSGTVILNAVLIRATGMELPKFADQYLFQPLGIKGIFWDTSSGGWSNIDGIVAMYPRAMARLGLLMLQNGAWQGEQVVPEDWIRQSTLEHVPLPFNGTWGKGYGYLWWLSEVPVAGKEVYSFAASGHGGQVIAVFPDLDMVVVFTGSNYDNDEGQPFEIMERFILPAVLEQLD